MAEDQNDLNIHKNDLKQTVVMKMHFDIISFFFFFIKNIIFYMDVVNKILKRAKWRSIDQQSLVNINFYYNISSIMVIFVHYLIFVYL